MKCFFILAAIAVATSALPSADTAVPEDEITSDGAFSEALAMLQDQGNNACNDLANATEQEVKDNIKKEQDLLNKIDTGSKCPNEGQAEVAAATRAKKEADQKLSDATSALSKAQGARVKWTDSTFSALNENNCNTFFSQTSYINAKNAVKAAQTARDKANGVADQAAKNVPIAVADAAGAVKKCQCTAYNNHKKELAAANGKATESNTAAWNKAAHLKCVVAGKAQNQCSVPPLPKITGVALANGVNAAACAQKQKGATQKGATSNYAGVKCGGNTNGKVVGSFAVGNYYKLTDPFTKHDEECAKKYSGSHQCTTMEINKVVANSAEWSRLPTSYVITACGTHKGGSSGWHYRCMPRSQIPGNGWKDMCNGQKLVCCR